MKLKSIVLAGGITSLMLLACAQTSEPDSKVDISPEQVSVSEHKAERPMLPVFTMQDATGNEVSLQSLKGKKVFVNLWASWCPPCRREMPSIEKLYQAVDSAKVAFVMLSLDDNFDKAKRFVKSRKLNLPIFYPAEDLPALFNVDGIPVTFIFNEKGELIQQVNGGDEYNTDEYKNLLE